MSWHPNDLVSDQDLIAYESKILTQFGQTDWELKRQRVLDDWLFPLLEARRFDPTRLRTRHAAATVLGYTSAVYTDRTAAATSGTLNLATVLAAESDALLIGFEQPFTGALLSFTESVNSTVTTAVSAYYWTGAWTRVTLTDGTKIGSKSLARGGSLTWPGVPAGTIRRTISNSASLYWARLNASAAPTGATGCGPITVIRRSRLAAAATFRTLALIFREAPIAGDGPWERKADKYEADADAAFSRAVEWIGPEFDSDQSDAVDATDRLQTSAAVSGGGFSLDRS